MVKRGQIDISFGVIFSIIIVIFTLAIAFYVITYFLNLQKCTNLGLFYKDLETDVDKAWYAPATSKTFSHEIPSNVDYVCFGNVTLGANSRYSAQYESLKRFSGFPENVFAYPTVGGCDTPTFYRLKHAQMKEFFCAKVFSGKVSLSIKKDVSDALVWIGP